MKRALGKERMKPPRVINIPFTVITLLLIANSAYSIRNLFLPRTGEIKISPVVPENLSNVTNFQSLLGAGRSLAYPFAAGMLLSISTLASENNWNVSDAGFAQVLGIPRSEILDSYGTLLEMLETDENVTLSNVLFSLRPNYSPSEDLTETLMTEVREVTWTRETWKETYNMMVEHLSNVTNEKVDTLLIPPVTRIGTPFRKSTEAIVLSTFHYINGWQNPWTDGEIGTFQGNGGIPYLITEGKFFVAEEEEFTAVAVPLEGGTKNVVFVLPHVNISSKYFRAQQDEEDAVDIVPFPTKWELKQIRLKVPAFNTTDVDQYGQELEQVGMNETFCTIIRDFFGRYPYYMRPMVQVNFLDFNEDFLELASATGVAVERYQSLFSIINGGGDKEVENSDDDERKQQQNKNKPYSEGNLKDRAGPKVNPNFSSAESSNDSVVVDQSGDVNLEAGITLPPDESDIPTLALDRSFLWYLNDSEVGPLFFGTVEILVNLEFAKNSTEPGGEDDDMGMTTMQPSPNEDGMTTMQPNENGMAGNSSDPSSEADVNAIFNEIEKFYLWSCRSFAPTSGAPNNSISVNGTREVPTFFSLSFDEDANSQNSSVDQISGSVNEKSGSMKPSQSDTRLG